MWVFGYGSLMWDNWEKKFQGIKYGKARLRGYHRSFNKKSVKNWGTRDTPCPTLGLEKLNGAKCIGIVFEFNDNQRQSIEAYLKNREGKSFQLVEREVELENGQKIMALTPINRHNMNTYIDNTDFNELVNIARKASGKYGSCFEYIQNIHMMCEDLGIKDKYVQKMWNVINYDLTPPEEF